MKPIELFEADHVIKEVFSPPETPRRHIVVLRLNIYSSTLAFFNHLVAIAQKDGFEVTPEDVRIEKYGGRSYSGTHGIEFDVQGELPALAQGKYAPISKTAIVR